MDTVSSMYIHACIYARERTLDRGLVTRGAPLRLHPQYRPTLVFRPTLTRSPRWPVCLGRKRHKKKKKNKTQKRGVVTESVRFSFRLKGFARVARAWHARYTRLISHVYECVYR